MKMIIKGKIKPEIESYKCRPKHKVFDHIVSELIEEAILHLFHLGKGPVGVFLLVMTPKEMGDGTLDGPMAKKFGTAKDWA